MSPVDISINKWVKYSLSLHKDTTGMEFFKNEGELLEIQLGI